MKTALAKLKVKSLLAGALILLVGRVAVAQFILGQPISLGQPVNTATWEYAPQLSTDGYSLYYQSGCRCDGDDPEIYVATRESVDGPWMNPQPIGSPISTNADELSPSLSLDGQQLYFSDGFRPDFTTVKRPGGMGSGDIWVSSWNEALQGWDEPQNFAAVNSTYRDYAPDISADGLEFYFSSNRPGGSGNADIWVSRRENNTNPWGPAFCSYP